MQDLLALANTANEAAIAWRESVEHESNYLRAAAYSIIRGAELVEAVDALTGAIVEGSNSAVPLTRWREVVVYAERRGVSVDQAMVQLVNAALSHGLDVEGVFAP